jgi:hypothetical protein
MALSASSIDPLFYRIRLQDLACSLFECGHTKTVIQVLQEEEYLDPPSENEDEVEDEDLSKCWDSEEEALGAEDEDSDG